MKDASWDFRPYNRKVGQAHMIRVYYSMNASFSAFSLHADFSMKNYFSFSQRHHRIALHFCGQLYDYDGYGCHTARSPTDLWDLL